MIKLDKFTPRPYQIPFFEAMENSNGKYRAAIFVGPRRLGKDYMVWNFCIRWALRRTTTVLYFLPEYKQAKSVIWDAISHEGVRFLDLIPPDTIKSLNASDLKVTFKNNSIIQLRGSDKYDTSVIGSNASLIVFSEFSRADYRAFEFASPIIAANGGSMVFISTPFGRNHFYDLWKRSERWPDWWRYLITVDDTGHISEEALTKEREIHSEEFIQQEYYCSWDRGVEGSFYARYITEMYKDGRIGTVNHDPSLPVFTAWDLGYNDQTVIILGQITTNNLVRVINCYANTNQPLSHYIKWLQSQPYIYSKHFAPHDIEVHDYQTGNTRIEMARSLGLNFEVREDKGKLMSATPRVSVADGIEKVMVSFSRVYIDQTKCKSLITALESYHREWDQEREKYKQQPYHDKHSDFADAFRIMCLTLDLHQKGMTEEDARNAYNKAMLEKNHEGFINPFSEAGNRYKGRML
jgi:phage terminase large subunit